MDICIARNEWVRRAYITLRLCLKRKGVGPKEIAILVASYVWRTRRDLGYGLPVLVVHNLTGMVCDICQHCKKEFATVDTTFCVMCWTWVQAKRWRLFWRRYNKEVPKDFKKVYWRYH